MIERPNDVILGEADLEPLHTFASFPVFMGCTSAPRSEDLLADMSFWISRGSGMIQLNPLLPLDTVYPEAHGSGCVGRLWEVHHKAFADFIAKYSPGSVLEIGGAHGTLAVNYQLEHEIPWTIIEPNPTPVEECKARIIKGFFGPHFDLGHGVDAVVHSHVFEHMYAPTEFVDHVARFLGPKKLMIFSVPNMRSMLTRKYTNCVNFEHTILLTEEYIENLLAGAGFRVVEREYFLDDHSIFYAAVSGAERSEVPLPSSLYERNRQAYLDYVDEHVGLVNRLNSRLDLERPTFLFGAHAQAQYLIGFGLDADRIVAVLDNDRNKQGKRLCGTDKLVYAPLHIRGLERPVVIVRAGTFTGEIVAQLREINGATEFILE